MPEISIFWVLFAVFIVCVLVSLAKYFHMRHQDKIYDDENETYQYDTYTAELTSKGGRPPAH